MEQPTKKIGRPRVVVTEAVREQWRLAKQRSNSMRARGPAPGNHGATAMPDENSPLKMAKIGDTLPPPTPFLHMCLKSAWFALARCICLAEIIAIVAKEGWYYNCCPTFLRKPRLQGQAYYCDHYAEAITDIKQRYKLILRVKDQSGTTTFTLFNKEVERLVHIPVEKDKPTTPIPVVFNNVVGKACAFDIKINHYNANLGYDEYTVVKISAETEPEGTEAAVDTDGMPAKRPCIA
ncbi:hypothetical protein POM88_022797 [Heracleum sosnowskyi]|uniref:Replication factor A C-terminal domain-containing protein n=1 Tax=Heracleum sosnowskyi TaxID=360622 RepID=A0AAD8IIJ7_9APIA|nr:hypothetical protein POM88_022797 [Heracleum sosnowskyi]